MLCGRRTGTIILALILPACGTEPRERVAASTTADSRPDPVDPRCTWPSEPTLLARDGGASLLSWELKATPWLDQPVIPDDPAYLAFRAAIRNAGGDRRWPAVTDHPEPTGEAEREIWRREQRNNELARSGRVGRIRPIHCLEALLFAYQHNRYSQLTHPTEFLASILRKRVGDEMHLRVQFAGGGDMLPPKSLYGIDRIEQAIADGWVLWVVLHNHTVKEHQGRPWLSAPVPSTSDVDISRSVARDLGLRQVRVTNGFYTIEVDAAELGELQGRGEH